MKRTVLIVLFVGSLLAAFPGFSQRQLFMADVAGLPLGRAGLKFEHMIQRRFSVGAYADGYFMNYTGFSVSPFMRFYTGQFTAPESLFVHLQLTAGSFNGPLSYRQYVPGGDYYSYTSDESFSAFGYGIGLGRQWLLSYNFMLELSGGFQYLNRNTAHEIMLDNVDHPGLYRLNSLGKDQPADKWFVTGPGGLIYLRLVFGFGWW